MAAAQAQIASASQEDRDSNLKDTESLASSILSLKASSTINSSQIANNLDNLSLENGSSSPDRKTSNDEQRIKESSQSIPKLIMESDADDLANNNNSSSTTNLNKLTLTSNDSSNSLSVNNVKSSNSRSPSPCRSSSCRSKSPNIKELPDHGVRFVHGYHLTEICENAVGNELMSKLVNDWRSLSIDELARLTPNIRFKYGYEYTSKYIDLVVAFNQYR